MISEIPVVTTTALLLHNLPHPGSHDLVVLLALETSCRRLLLHVIQLRVL